MLNVFLNVVIIMATFSLGYFFRFITLQYKKREQEISDKLYATFTASLDGIIIIDDQGAILEFSASAETIFGYKRDDIIGKKMVELIVPKRYREAHEAGMARLRKTGVAKIIGQRIEIEAIRANGEEFMSELAISRSQDKNRNIFIAYIRDISEKKAAETALKEAMLAAEAASEAKSKFLAMMSHELRTPFNAVLGILGILEDTQLDYDQKNLVSTAKDSSEALLNLVNEVLDYAKITSGTVELVAKPFNPSDIVKDVKSLFGPIARENNVALIIELSEDLEDAVLGDSSRIKQVLMNFVSNAVKFTKDGTITISVETHDTPENQVELSYRVRDTGVGINEEKQEKLFDEFYMVDASDTRETSGTGLGLAISKKLVHLMGGKIGVESTLGEGSTFWMKVPFERTVMSEQEPEEIIVSPASLEGLSIILAEDNKTNQLVTNRVLKGFQAKVTIAENGQEVIDLLDKERFDLILMDISMPVMGGLEATKHIRKSKTSYNEIPIIALTAMASLEDSENFRKAGMNSVLIKPVKKAILANSISKVLSPVSNGELEGITPGVLKELLDGATEAEFHKFKTQFEDDLVGALNQLKAALETLDQEKAAKASHILKGLATTFGFSDLSETAALTNTYCKSGKNNTWVSKGHLTEETGRKALKNIDAVFDHVEVSAA